MRPHTRKNASHTHTCTHSHTSTHMWFHRLRIRSRTLHPYSPVPSSDTLNKNQKKINYITTMRTGVHFCRWHFFYFLSICFRFPVFVFCAVLVLQSKNVIWLILKFCSTKQNIFDLNKTFLIFFWYHVSTFFVFFLNFQSTIKADSHLT